MTTLQDLLKLPQFANLQVLNEQADLSRKIDTIEISETPDVASFMPKNTFLLTTAMAFKDDDDALCQFIASLNNMPAAGIGIKLGRFVTEIPQKVLDFADSLAFPIIQIPMSLTLGTVSHQLLSYIWDQQTEKLQYALDIQQNFSNLMMKGADLTSLIRHLGTVLKRPVLLANPFGEIIASSIQANQTILSHINMENLQIKIKEAQEQSKEVFAMMNRDTDPLLVSIFPINITHYFPYALIIFRADQIPYPFSQMAIEQANTVIAYTIYKNMTLENDNRQHRKEYFSNLFETNDDIKDYHNLLENGRNFGIVNTNFYQVILINVDSLEVPHEAIDEISALTYKWIENFVQNTDDTIQVFPTSVINQYIMLFQSPVEKLEKLIFQMQEKIFNQLNIQLSFAIGNPVKTFNWLPFSYKESLEAMQDGMERLEKPFIQHFEAKGIQKIMAHIPADDAYYFCLSVLKSLAFPDTEMEKELRHTLQIYLDYQCEITETANQLYIHRNTVKYRIAKCEKIFNRPIRDPELSLQLRLALYLSEPKK